MGSARNARTHKTSADHAPAVAAVSRAPARNSTPTSSNVVALQSRIGNSGVLALARAAESTTSVAAASQLRVSSPNDPAEVEATRVAAHVARATDNAPVVSPVAAAIQRAASPPPSSNRGERAAPASVTARIANSMNGGTALPMGVRTFMEPRFGANFGSVRIHNNENAAGLNKQLNARAFTVGNHIFFGRNQFQPNRREGKELIAHELTHTIQQGGAAQRSIQRGILDDAASWIAEQGGIEAIVRSALSIVAPNLVSLIGPGGFLQALASYAMKALESLFDTLKQPLNGILGVGEQVAAALGPIIEAIQQAGVQIARNDCTPIRVAAEKIEQFAMRLLTPVIELVQPVIAGIKKFLEDVWNKLGVPIVEFIKDSAAEQWKLIKEIADLVQKAAKWLWDKTEGLREPYIKMWNLLKDILGLGDSPEGQNGILQWAEQKLTAAWDAIKVKLQPYTQQLKAIGIAVGAVLLALSPVGPILALGAAAVEVGKGISWVAANWGKGNIIATARVFVEKTLLPPLVAALDKVTATVTSIANSISTALTGLAASLVKTVAVAGGTAIGLIIRLTQWLSDQAQALATFVNTKLADLKLWLGGAFDKLVAFLRKVMNFLSRVGDVIIDIYGLPVLLGEAIWNAVPQCIRDPIVDFLGPIILRQIELFSELVKDDEAWKKTKEEVGRLIKLVFHDKNLIGAIKAAFFFVLRIFNLPPDLLAAVGAKAVAAWDTVTKAPLEFIKTTLKAIAQGFKIIWDDKLENIKNGLQGWLLGEIKDKNIVMPKDWTDLGQIFEFVLSVLGISVEHTYELLKKRLRPEQVQKFREIMGKVQRVMEWVDKSIDVTKSPKENAAGMLKQAQDFGLTLLEAGAEWIIKKVAAKVTEEIVKAAATAGFGAILTAAQSLYAALVTAKKWMRQILDMANKALDNVMDLVAGAVGKVGGVFAELMKKAMPVIIGFLADQVGLGDIARELGKAIDKLRAKVDTAILWIIDKIKAGIEWLIGVGKGAIEAVKEWWKERRAIKAADGKPHELLMEGGEANAEIMVKSNLTKLTVFLQNIIDGKGTKEFKKAASDALDYYKKYLFPALKVKSKKPEEIKLFKDYFTKMSEMLAELFQDDDVPSKPIWKNFSNQAKFATVEQLSPAGVTKGSDPDDSVKGWKVLQTALLTKKKDDWKQMHMITQAVGGLGHGKNIIPAPTSVNSGGTVRGFELRLEALLKKSDKPNVVWVSVRTTGFHPASVDQPKDLSYDDSTFATGVRMELGRQVKNKSKEWEKMAPEMTAEASIRLPNFDGAAADFNSLGRVYVERVTKVTEHYANVIVKLRQEKGDYQSITDLTMRLDAQEASDPHSDATKYKDTIRKLVRAHVAGKIAFPKDPK